MKKKILRTILYILILLYLAAIAVLYTRVYLIPKVTGAMTSTAIATYDKIEETNGAHCLIIREEQVITAGQSGTVSYYSKEGEKNRMGTKVLDVYPSGETANPSTCPRTGFISYYIDGMEQEFLPEPEELRQLDASQLAGLQIASFDMQKKNCSAGDPLYKLVSSDIWYMALVCDSRCKDLYSEGQTITVCFAENAVQRAQEASGASNADTPGEKEASSAESSEQQNTAQFSLLSEDEGLVKIPATVLSCEENNGYLLVIASTRRYYEDFVRLRTTDVNVITSSCEGLLIPRTAVTQQEGVFGVYQKLNNGEYSFLPVNIIGENDSDYVITPTSFERTGSDGSKETVTTVKVYDEILRNAEDTRK